MSTLRTGVWRALLCPLVLHMILMVLLAPPCLAGEDHYRAELEQLARRGDAQAQFALALALDESADERQHAQAIRWYQEAARHNLPAACLYLGMKYEHGNGVKKNRTTAMQLYRIAAVHGQPMAQLLLGALALDQHMAEQAFIWLSLAAEQGDAERAGELLLQAEKLLQKKGEIDKARASLAEVRQEMK